MSQAGASPDQSSELPGAVCPETHKRPLAVVAHRGASGTHPENTAVAFAEAVRLGVESIELDVHRSADGGLLLIHDGTVDRTSDGSGRVAGLTTAEILALDAGSWFDATFSGERFLVFEEALDLIPDAVRLNVHVKAYDHDRQLVAPEVVDVLAAAGRLDNAFMAADEATLVCARQREPSLEVCNLSVTPADDYVARSERIGCRILQPGHGMTTKALVDDAHARGMEVNPFFADETEEMLRLIGCGVDGILTNLPERLQQLLQAPTA
ncbi:MAG TPA: glycerophosphodiester phosphodiesterase family protein [Candidatus Latescibacteria bacterium]|nr:glycerophosphodiester phosphodiesterase family protein [Candidatus Latescibacterota bacterium]HJP28993.1 glycerophosphodiester phosphodiesterase family protein [Candidatus Latescibacterota bacterium]